MDSTYGPLDNYGLHKYALIGDDEGVRRALSKGADINALDTAGRTALMCVVAGEHWQNIDAYDASFMSPKRLNALKIILSQPDISLFTLNAPHSSMNGVIPLCMAAWLNQPDAVQMLLEESVDSVSVDGMDAHGATALMYAARDGSLEVVRVLLSHGARPDFRDRNHRTSVQFALPYPQILWLCETVLRRHRWRESKSADRTRLCLGTERIIELACASMPSTEDLEPPPLSIFTQEAIARLTNTLVSCIRSCDVAFMHSLLFSPAVHASSPPALYPMSVPPLVNVQDANGWSLIHHCCAAEYPSIEILDTLYCAGADVSAFTAQEQQTPLHVLARFAHSTSAHDYSDSIHSLQQFTLHLVQDLRAPLLARDKDDETCIHLAAEHGHSIELLMLLIECDSTGAVRKMRNSRGLTPLEVAKKEFAHAFVSEKDNIPASALSNCNMRPSDSFASLSSLSDLKSPYHGIISDGSSIFSSSDTFDVGETTHQLLLNLRATSTTLAHPRDPAHIQSLEDRLDETSAQCNSIVIHFRSRIEEAARVVDDLKKSAARIGAVRDGVVLATRSKSIMRQIKPMTVTSRRRQRDSEDSQTTAVHGTGSSVVDDDAGSAPSSPSSLNRQLTDRVSTGVQTTLLDLFVVTNSPSPSDAAWTERFVRSPESGACRAHFEGIWDAECQLAQIRQQQIERASSVTPTPTSPGSVEASKSTLRLKHIIKKKKKLEDKIMEIEADSDHLRLLKKDTMTGPSRVKAWLKRMMVTTAAAQAVEPSQQALPKLQIVLDLEDQGSCFVGHEIKRPHSHAAPKSTTKSGDALDASIDNALRTSPIVLENAHRDLISIGECLAAAEQFIDSANHSISRTQRIVKRALKKREALIADLHAAATAEALHPQTSDLLSAAADTSADTLSPGLLGYTTALSLSARPSLASISTIYSTASSVASVAATLTENDDEDTRIIRRLLLRKIEAQTSGAWDEVDKVTGWLSIVKESVRSVKRRAYL
ncbi:Ankyrin repeat domain-containing protein 55 [Psilocybe cubensis]|uniref:Ankyrin repeat domain-containing protein 55 n=2 Tax=Psilocybe cubensis TaxID=181762 RepID=A0ACB8H1L3_PSICU|nr:Ankyrin repeat domain-containing protein 55 [Psilocybe cubensis]KAH9481761.1 Ankyrin repeat domain-containing protein 55 [Psilocybe cubensis]